MQFQVVKPNIILLLRERKNRSRRAAARRSYRSSFISSGRARRTASARRSPSADGIVAAPISPYGWSKLMTEIMLRDAGTAHGLSHVMGA
jgi:UDP-glucose 4-epimerase